MEKTHEVLRRLAEVLGKRVAWISSRHPGMNSGGRESVIDN